jgi:hypothetical protein
VKTVELHIAATCGFTHDNNIVFDARFMILQRRIIDAVLANFLRQRVIAMGNNELCAGVKWRIG